MYISDSPQKKIPSIVVKKTKKESPFQKSKRIQLAYERKLRGVAREVIKLIKAYNPIDTASVEKLKQALNSYVVLIEPWARRTSHDLINEILSQDVRSWKEHTKEMGKALRDEILNAPTGEVFRQLMEQNVSLIKSIPIEAAQKVHEMVIENLSTGDRPISLIDEIVRIGNVTTNRATLIARTETARAANTLVQSRAQAVGSEGYIWRTSNDLVVRLSHRKMNGTYVKWSEPPELDKMTGHAGMLPNCRCWPQPVLPEG